MTQTKKNVEELNNLIKEGKIREAFEKYYSEEVVIQVNGNPQVSGKEQNRKREMIFLRQIEKLNNVEVKSVTFGGTDDSVSMTEWAIDLINKKGEQKIVYRVNVQHWKDDKIINEKLFFCGDEIV